MAGRSTSRPFSFYTEASIDLADRPELLAAMVEANFMYVFIGIETPSAEALKESKKFQNLRKDNVEQIRIIQESGLWVLGGFIVGFDSDDETIFDRQREFIEQTAITWAMAGVLQAPPTTALYDRMKREGRLYRRQPGALQLQRAELPHRAAAAGAAARPQHLAGRSVRGQAVLRARPRSLEVWQPRASQKPPELPMSYNLRVLAASMWRQGMRSRYKQEYWKFLYSYCAATPAIRQNSGWDSWSCSRRTTSSSTRAKSPASWSRNASRSKRSRPPPRHVIHRSKLP